jgi:hypothetical protein
MLMKVNEAHKFICQEMSRAPLDKDTTVYCQGLSCASWRWKDSPSIKKDRRGYCGKVGSPLTEFYEG